MNFTDKYDYLVLLFLLLPVFIFGLFLYGLFTNSNKEQKYLESKCNPGIVFGKFERNNERYLVCFSDKYELKKY
jgi:hypothetical protein